MQSLPGPYAKVSNVTFFFSSLIKVYNIYASFIFIVPVRLLQICIKPVCMNIILSPQYLLLEW